MKVGRSLKARALSFLALRDHSRAELSNKLKAYAASEEELATTLAALEADGWLSENRFAEGVVRAKSQRYGRAKIAQTLREKGVGTEQIAAATADLDDLTTAKALWERKFGKAPADAKEKARHVRFLQSRGFSLSIVFKVIGGASDGE